MPATKRITTPSVLHMDGKLATVLPVGKTVQSRMGSELNLAIYLVFDSGFREDTIAEEELTLIRSILPQIIRDIAVNAERIEE